MNFQGLSLTFSLPTKNTTTKSKVKSGATIVYFEIASGYEGIVHGQYGKLVATSTVYVNTFTANPNTIFVGATLNLIDPNAEAAGSGGGTE